MSLTHHQRRTAAPSRLLELDLVRGLSALAVLLGHLRLVIWPDFHLLSAPDNLQKMAYFLTGFGNQAVLIFFVLSGYLVGGSVWSSRGNPQLKAYLIARLSRLWLVLIPALVFTYLVDLWILRFDPGVLASPRLANFSSDGGVYVIHHDFWVFLGNLTFVQTVWVPVFGSNGPLWSLACEAWYYLLFPMCVWGVAGRKTVGARIAWLVLTMCVLALMPQKMLMLFPAWLAGAAVHWVPYAWTVFRSTMVSVALLGLFVVALTLHRLDVVPQLFARQNDWALAIFCAAWCTSLHHGRKVVWAGWVRSVVIRMSDVSFTMYIFHMPMVFLVAVSLGHWGAIFDYDALSVSWVLLLVATFIILIVTWIFWLLFERHSLRLRAWISGVL